MKLKDIRGAYESYSGKASDVGRQLAFAGIATIWLFHIGDSGQPNLPKALISPLVFFTLALALDFLHYVVSAAVWGIYGRVRELKRTHQADDKDIDAPGWINWAGLAFFWSKVASLVFAQFLLIHVRRTPVGSDYLSAPSSG